MAAYFVRKRMALGDRPGRKRRKACRRDVLGELEILASANVPRTAVAGLGGAGDPELWLKVREERTGEILLFCITCGLCSMARKAQGLASKRLDAT